MRKIILLMFLFAVSALAEEVDLDSPYRQCRSEVSSLQAENLYLRGYVQFLIEGYPEIYCEVEEAFADEAKIRRKIRELRRKLKSRRDRK